MTFAESLLWIAASNTAVASVIAALAYVVQRSGKSMCLAHCLWVLVLVKLVTPPLFEIPVATAITAPPAASILATPDLPHRGDAIVAPSGEDGSLAALLAPLLAEAELAPATNAGSSPAVPATTPTFFASIDWSEIGLFAWLAGAILALFVACSRAFAFHRSLRHAAPASPEALRELRALAKRIGTNRIPRLEVLPSQVSPMLWSFFGRAKILLPRDLERNLDRDQRRTLLAHELAHYRRGDHRVRVFEMIVSALYWWNPLTWLARRQMRACEEECCDAWVVWALPESSRSYADTLIDTVEFLSDAKRVLPASASGMSGTQELKRRLEMIMRGTTSHRLGYTSRFAVVGVALLALPPAFAQERHADLLPIAIQNKSVHDRDSNHQDEKEAVLRALKRAIHLLMEKDHSRDAIALEKLAKKILHSHKSNSNKAHSKADTRHNPMGQLARIHAENKAKHEMLRSEMKHLERKLAHARSLGRIDEARALEKKLAAVAEHRHKLHAKSNSNSISKRKASLEKLHNALRHLSNAHDESARRGDYAKARQFAAEADKLRQQYHELSGALRLANRNKAKNTNPVERAIRLPGNRNSANERVRRLEAQVRELTEVVHKLMRKRGDREPEEMIEEEEIDEPELIEEPEVEVEEIEPVIETRKRLPGRLEKKTKAKRRSTGGR